MLRIGPVEDAECDRLLGRVETFTEGYMQSATLCLHARSKGEAIAPSTDGMNLGWDFNRPHEHCTGFRHDEVYLQGFA